MAAAVNQLLPVQRQMVAVYPPSVLFVHLDSTVDDHAQSTDGVVKIVAGNIGTQARCPSLAVLECDLIYALLSQSDECIFNLLKTEQAVFLAAGFSRLLKNSGFI